jgi:hypothetical protein
MSDNVRLVYEGPLQIVFEEGVYGVLELGGSYWADNAAERLHDLIEGPKYDDGYRKDMTLHDVRLVVEVIERDPPPPPRDPVQDFVGPPPQEMT